MRLAFPAELLVLRASPRILLDEDVGAVKDGMLETMVASTP